MPHSLSFLSHMVMNELLLRAFYSAIVFIPVFVCCRLLGERRPYLQLTLWSLVLIRAALPSSFSLPFSLRQAVEYLNPDPGATLGFPLRCITTSECSDALHRLPLPGDHYSALIMTLLWLFIASYLAWRFFHLRQRYKKALNAAVPATQPQLLLSLAQWQQRFDIHRPVQIRIGTQLSPFTMGVMRPVIYLPEAVAQQDDAMTSMVIGHEMAHIKRFDDIWILLCGVAAAIYFFLPPLRFAVRQLHLQRERVCDQLVVSSGNVNAGDYAHHLLGACSQHQWKDTAVAGLSAHAAIYSSRFAAISEAAALGIRGIPVALLTLTCAMLFVMPMQPFENAPLFDRGTITAQGGPFVLPVASHQYGSLHGEKIPAPDGSRVHTGIDLIAAVGSPVIAMADGVVEQRASRNYNHAGGRRSSYLVIRHGAYMAYYTYLDAVTVGPGDSVHRGQLLGVLDASATTIPSKGPHLHFEVLRDGVSIDPLQLFASHAP